MGNLVSGSAGEKQKKEGGVANSILGTDVLIKE